MNVQLFPFTNKRYSEKLSCYVRFGLMIIRVITLDEQDEYIQLGERNDEFGSR